MSGWSSARFIKKFSSTEWRGFTGSGVKSLAVGAVTATSSFRSPVTARTVVVLLFWDGRLVGGGFGWWTTPAAGCIVPTCVADGTASWSDTPGIIGGGGGGTFFSSVGVAFFSSIGVAAIALATSLTVGSVGGWLEGTIQGRGGGVRGGGLAGGVPSVVLMRRVGSSGGRFRVGVTSAIGMMGEVLVVLTVRVANCDWCSEAAAAAGVVGAVVTVGVADTVVVVAAAIVVAVGVVVVAVGVVAVVGVVVAAVAVIVATGVVMAIGLDSMTAVGVGVGVVVAAGSVGVIVVCVVVGAVVIIGVVDDIVVVDVVVLVGVVVVVGVIVLVGVGVIVAGAGVVGTEKEKVAGGWGTATEDGFASPVPTEEEAGALALEEVEEGGEGAAELRDGESAKASGGVAGGAAFEPITGEATGEVGLEEGGGGGGGDAAR